MPGKDNKTLLTVRVDPEMMTWLDETSLKDRRSRSEFLRMILEHCMSTIEHPSDLYKEQR